MANNPIPVYVFTGFLESGKTKFIQEILADPNFTENEVTALLLCEEGIEEYDEKWLAHYGTALVPVESEDRLTPNILKRIEQKYNPDRIIVEYNGMWKLESLMQAFPARWELYQIITTVDATTFEVYSNNIGRARVALTQKIRQQPSSFRGSLCTDFGKGDEFRVFHRLASRKPVVNAGSYSLERS